MHPIFKRFKSLNDTAFPMTDQDEKNDINVKQPRVTFGLLTSCKKTSKLLRIRCATNEKINMEKKGLIIKKNE